MSRASSAAPATHSKRELWVALLVLALGTPFVFAFARAMADGEQRRRQGPLRALLGEFRDHGMVVATTGAGGEAMWIPMRRDALMKIVGS